ncbi:MAG TPA: YceI family protein [Motilibacterales bacterium]|nr:YceI family protein [Motilibacterales bacterium]
MTDYNSYTGTWTIDPSHTNVGFVARHAMVTKVRGAFEDVAGTIVIDGANPSGSTASVMVALASVTTGSPDRDAHLRGPDFFDVEVNKEMTFTTTTIKHEGDQFMMAGHLTIKGVTRPVEIEFEPTGVVTDPFGNVRAGFEGEAELSRKEFGLVWNVALEAGGVLVSDKIRIQLDVSATRTA